MIDFDLKDIFTDDLIFIDDKLKSRHEVFSFIAEHLKEKKIIDGSQVDEIVSALESREQIGSTGIGKEIAVPHITIKNLNKIVGCVVKCEKGIAWDAIDGKPVRLIVFLFAPETQRQTYLRILAEIAQVLNIPALLSKIIKAKKTAAIHQYITGSYEQSFFEKYSRVIYFALALIGFFVAAKLIFSYVKLPDLAVYQKLDYLRFNQGFWVTKEIISTVLFFSMVLGTLLFFRYRVAFGAAALSLLLIAGVMDIETTVKFMSIPTILFIVAVMILVKWVEDKGVFKFLVVRALRYFYRSPFLLFGALMIFSTILSGFIGEVSAILITFGLAIEISRYTKVGVVPYLLGLVMATNVGSALTLIGNPIGVYLGFAGKLTFIDFVKNATPISILTSLLVVVVILFIYRKETRSKITVDINEIEKKMVVDDKKELRIAGLVFIIFIVLIILHSVLEKLLGVEELTLLLAVPMAMVGFIVFREEDRGRYLVEKGPDWWTILYFMFLFANAACLEYTGVTAKLAHLLTQAANIMPFGFMGNLKESASILSLLLWGSGMLSGFVDNLPVVAALVPIVKDLNAQGILGANIFWWSLLIGGCFGGNLTMIGSTANLVAIGFYEKSFRKRFLFKEWIKIGIIITVLSLLFANILLLLKLKFHF